MRRVLPVLALVGVLGAIFAVAGISIRVARAPRDPAAARRSRLQQVTAYEATRTRGPSFRLAGSETVLKLTSAAEWPARGYDPGRVVHYGLALSISLGGKQVWRHEIFEDSHQSKRFGDDGTVIEAAVTAADPSLELADQRVSTVVLPEIAPGSELTITVLGEPARAWLRVFSRYERSPDQRRLIARTLRAGQADELAESVGLEPWALLGGDDRLALLRYRHERLFAIGERGTDYVSETLFLDPLAVALPPVAAPRGFAVTPTAWAALNLRGPGEVALEVRRGPGGAAANLSLASISDGAALAPRTIAIPPGGATPRLELPPGAHSLLLSSDAPVVVVALARPEVAIGAVGLRVGERVEVAPDRVEIPLALTRPDGEPLVVDLEPIVRARGPIGQSLRIDSRGVTADPDQLATCAVALELRAADGRVLETHHVQAGGPAIRFEALTGLAAPAWVSEPSSARLLVPAAAVTLAVTSDRPCAHRFYRLGPGPVELAPPYRDVPLTVTHYRYPRLTHRNWFPFEAADLAIAASHGQVARLWAQIRLATDTRGDEDVGGRTRPVSVIIPEGAPERQLAREPVPDERLDAIAERWPPGTVARLAAGSWRIRFRADRPARARLYFHARPDAVGRALAVDLDGAAWLRAIVPSTAGYLELPRTPPGEDALGVTIPDGVALWIDRPVVGRTAGLARLRTLYAVGDEPIRVEVTKRADERVVVNAVVYAPSRAAGGATLRITVGGGHPLRREGVFARLTTPARDVVLPVANRDAPALLVDLDERAAGYPRTIAIPLLDDLVAGRHEIDLRSLGGKPLWIRFYVDRVGPAGDEDALQWRFDDGPEASDGSR